MSEYYDNVFVNEDGIVYARGDDYRRIKNLHVNANITNTYQPINNVPRLRELLWLSYNAYVGVTVDDELFSFRDNNSVHFDSPIVSVHIIGDDDHILVLLKNGKLRLVYYDQEGQLISINQSVIDQNITQDIVILSPLPKMNPKIERTTKFLAITSNNEFLVIELSYPTNSMIITRRSTNSYEARLRVIEVLKNTNNLNYHHIVKINRGHILMDNDKIYTINSSMDGYYIGWTHYDVKDVIDLLPLINDNTVLLTGDGQLHSVRYRDDELITGAVQNINPIKLLSRYYVDSSSMRHNIVMSGDEIIIQGTNGIYRVELNGGVTELI